MIVLCLILILERNGAHVSEEVAAFVIVWMSSSY